MKFSKASKGSSQSSKGRKPSLLSQLMRPIKRFGKSLRKKSDTPQSESETRHVTPSTTVSLPVVEPSTAQGLDTIASMTEPTTTTAPAPAATASDTTASGPTASAPDASAIRPPVAAHSNVPPSSPEHSTADAAVPNREKSEAVTSIPANRDMNELKEMSLWDKACVSLKARDQDSKYLRVLEKNLNEMDNRDTIAKDIQQIVNTKQDKLRAKDSLTQSTDRKFTSRSVRFMMSTKDLAMGLARLDPHKIAPIVLGGVYTIVQVLQNDTEEFQTAMTTTLELAGIVALWTCIEESQIQKNLNPRLDGLYQRLSGLIVNLYEGIIVLFGTMMAYHDKSRFRQIVGAITPAHSEWKNMQAEIKSCETNCNNTKNEITIEKENQEKESAILKWISSHDIRGSYQDVIERTGIEKKYSSRCQWLLNHTNFEEWSSLGNNSVLWLKGTIGTGKTTLMARAIREMKNTTRIEEYGIAIFFFKKAAAASISSVETCLRSLVRQLSWNSTIEAIEPLVEKKYDGFQTQHSGDSLLSIGECRELLKTWTSENETYIMIDAIDECENPYELLRELQDLNSLLHNNEKGHQALHTMLCGRDDFPISDYFENCLTIATNSADSLEDQEFYINHEIDSICQTKKGSLFASPSEDYPRRLKKVLKEKGGGLFRWIEIQLEVLKVKDFETFDEIEELLDWLGSHTKHQTLDKEYARLLSRKEKTGRNYKRALKMLRLIACSFDSLTVDDLAEAITASEYADDSTKELTPDEIRRILVGFISESETRPLKFRIHGGKVHKVPKMDIYGRPKGPTVRLAHSSVLEYLTDKSSHVERFSILEQHSEAASLCFSQISALKKPPQLPPNAESSPSDGASVEKEPNFLRYSCTNWPSHCRRAFDEDARCPLVEETKEFILSDRYMRWNDTIRSYDSNRALRGFSTIGYAYDFFCNLWCNDHKASPGFVIARFNLKELLRFSKIRDLINLQSLNGHEKTLLLFSMEFSLPSTVDQLIGMYPNQVRPSNEHRELSIAASGGLASVVNKLLDNGEDVNVRAPHGKSALCCAISKIFGLKISSPGRTLEDEKVQPLLDMIRILLKRGANIFEFVNGSSNMHWVAISGLYALFDLIVEHAKELERSGLPGSVQRLLRARDHFGYTPEEVPPGKYLPDQLVLAMERNDNKIMYDFDNPNVAEIREGRVSKPVLMEYLRDSSTANQLDVGILKEGAKQYRDWIDHRHRELEEEYEAKKRQLGSSGVLSSCS